MYEKTGSIFNVIEFSKFPVYRFNDHHLSDINLQVKIKKEDIDMEIKSALIKDTTKEERIRIVQEGLNQCGGACDFCNGCDNLGGGSVDTFYEPYINGEKELRQINEEYKAGMVK